MQYVSTRGRSPEVGFPEVMLAGLAPDGGLYMPELWPGVASDIPSGAPYSEVLASAIAPYVSSGIPPSTLRRLAADSVAGFPVPDVVPLREIEEGLFVLELFWGPTLAFKDLGLQVLARLFEEVGRPVTIVGATSGDTGAAAIQAFRGRRNVVVVILHPDGRISEVQRRQMTTVENPNVHNVAVEGTFDDCQALVKSLLSDDDLRSQVGLASANSINWFRIAAQSAYYTSAALRLSQKADFSVPSGNFGNAFSAFAARETGSDIGRIVVATNINRGIADLLVTGSLRVERALPTMSPAMDIQVPSNLERALYEAFERDPGAVGKAMTQLDRDRELTIDGAPLSNLQSVYQGEVADEEQTAAELAAFHRDHGRLIDPHTAVALVAARRRRTDRPMVAVATAHPGKFPEAVARATGTLPALPERLAELFERQERLVHLPNDYAVIRSLVAEAAGESGEVR